MSLPKPDPAQQKVARSEVRSKARLLQKKGVRRYRLENRLGRVTTELEPELQAELLRACGQIVAGRGFSAKNPLEGIGVASCYALLDTFHFQAVGRRSSALEDGMLDEMRCLHRVTPDKVWVVYNLVAFGPAEPVS
ncbi:MAG TPA: hypothetical protein DFR83_05060 [Deltaproteobacteria bacterium]|nr:hypothetical protein [Deltaproteobacteria bacterium]